MADLRKRQGDKILHKMREHHESSKLALSHPSKASIPSSMTQAIRYIPPQIDPMASLSTLASRQNPIRLILQDTGVLISNLKFLPGIVLPFKANNPSDEFYLNLMGLRDTLLQGGLFLLETVLLLLAAPVILILPGALWMCVWAACSLAIYLLCKPMEGPTVVYSNMSDETLALAEQHKDERWLFVNGCIVGHSGLQKAIDRLAKTFGRAVIGVHNQTWGLPADLIECLIQRAFAYQTMDVRVAYSYVKATLVDPTVSKVVLIGHSQGGIIVSLVIDKLLVELPAECMSKLEVYTFGSAASHFSNPLLSLPSKTDLPVLRTRNPDKSNPPTNLISHIEHYANEKDLVPRWGVLHCTQDVLNNRYAGSIFVRMGASGHMFNQHYMDPMFPFPEENTHWLKDTFLDRVIQVDENLAIRRDSMVVSNIGLMRRTSGLEFGDGEIVPEVQVLPSGSNSGPISNGDPVLTFSRTNSGRLLVEEAKGKTVRELSRLWRYQGGRSPEALTPPSERFTTETPQTLTRYGTAQTG